MAGARGLKGGWAGMVPWVGGLGAAATLGYVFGNAMGVAGNGVKPLALVVGELGVVC